MLAENMRAVRLLLTAGLLVGSLASAGCQEEDTADGDDHSGDHHDDAGHDDHHDDGSHGDDHPEGMTDEEEVPCTPDYPSYSAGLGATVGDLTVKLVEIDPEPPRQLQRNTWTVEVVDGAGEPVADAELPLVKTWMPVHNHGGRKDPTIEPLAKAGQFKLDGVDFKMPGPWQVLFDVKRSGEPTPARATLQICVE